MIIAGNAINGYRLDASTSIFHRTWIIAELITPTTAAGFYFAGQKTLYAYDAGGLLLGSASYIQSGSGHFLGITSDIPFARIISDRGDNVSTMQAFMYKPVPEPATLGLLSLFPLLWRCKGQT